MTSDLTVVLDNCRRRPSSNRYVRSNQDRFNRAHGDFHQRHEEKNGSIDSMSTRVNGVHQVQRPDGVTVGERRERFSGGYLLASEKAHLEPSRGDLTNPYKGGLSRRAAPELMDRVGFMALTAAVAFGTLACSSHDAQDQPPAIAIGPETKATCPTVQTLTSANFGSAFISKYCLRCHSASAQGDARNGAPSDHNFDLAKDIRALASHIDQYAGSGPAATNMDMPNIDPKPTTEERRKLSEWLACGAP